MTPTRLVALVALTAVAVGVALVLQRRRPDPPSAPSYRAPAQLDRDDFTSRASELLIVLFASTTCDTCPQAWAAIGQLAERWPTERVGTVRLDVQTEPDLHRRYRIDGVPTTLVADADGVVAQAFFGPVTVDDLAEAVDPLL